jgi:hypothetical protein
MKPEELEAGLRDSPYLRQSLGDLLRSVEQAVTLIILALVGRQDAARFEAELLRLQSEAAAHEADPARDRILDNVRQKLRALKRGG